MSFLRRSLFIAVVISCKSSMLGADEPGVPYWNVDDLKQGMKGEGRTVMRGTKIERFAAEVLGVLKNTSPGRDMILCRLAGLDLERSGVIAGMSGSPIYIEGKLVGAVAYAWPFGKDPIAGVTPFAQMKQFADAVRSKSEAPAVGAARLPNLIRLDGRDYSEVTIADEPRSASNSTLQLIPIRTPINASGFTPHALRFFEDQTRGSGLVPVQGGAVPAKIADDSKNVRLEPGAAMTVALITGDFDMSGIGTVTHVEGTRVYGWGHPFVTAGSCDFPMMTGHVVAVYPRQNVSFKIGSPIRPVGAVTADVSTCIAGEIGREADMLPLTAIVRFRPDEKPQKFQVRVARHKHLLPQLVQTVLVNSIDMQGELPEELTARIRLRVEMAGRPPLIFSDTFSSPTFTGARAPGSMYGLAAQILSQLVSNPFDPIRVTNVECETQIEAGRRTADLEGVELVRDSVAPGDTLKATAFLRIYKGKRVAVPIELPIPKGLDEGAYQATVGDDLTATRADLRGQPHLLVPANTEHMLAALHLLTSAQRTNLVMRVALPATGVAFDRTALSDLPAGVVQQMGWSRRVAVTPLTPSVSVRVPQPWTINGTETIRFSVSSSKIPPP